MLFFLHPPKPWKVPKILLPSGGQIFYTTLLSPGPTAGAGNGSTDCSGPFDTQPWKLLTDQQPGAGTGPIDCSSPFNTRAWKLLADEQPDGLLGTDRTRPPQPPPSNPCLLLDKAQSEA
ncbi:uncharacterized protein LOC100858183 isoform X4 [Gallus gallus]|uniref:uncharacterized protein LOC100858183 isoform X4 n=1 Tax=Gallus gallus TaxID=9031 RepID=UPI001AE7D4A1|nr:uncharacterized protein LOC100858183 isoform X4 [Gallus gallus]